MSPLQTWLTSRILSNVLFLGLSKWLKLQSKAMIVKLGQTETVYVHDLMLADSSVLLMYCIGFGCKSQPGEDEHRSGPFTKSAANDGVPIMTDAEFEQMDRYMMRTWLEIEVYLNAYRKRNREVAWQIAADDQICRKAQRGVG